MKSFDRDQILQQLAALSERQLVAYAVACAERLLPLYHWFQGTEEWGDSSVLERGIELAWSWAKGEQHQRAEIEEMIRDCEAVAPDTEDFESPLASRALDAASAVAQALEVCISPLPDTAADAGEIAWECAFGVEQSRLLEAGIPHIADREILDRAAHSGFVLLEEDLQQRSLTSLRQAPLLAGDADAFRNRFAKLAD